MEPSVRGVNWLLRTKNSISLQVILKIVSEIVYCSMLGKDIQRRSQMGAQGTRPPK